MAWHWKDKDNKRKKYTKEDVTKFRELRKQLLTYDEIESLTGVPKATICRLFNEYGI